MKHEGLDSFVFEASLDIERHRFDKFYQGYGKRIFDFTFSLLLAPIVMVTAVFLLLLNPIFNPGPLFFVQPRMGRNCKAFAALKFRTMRPVARVTRKADDPVEDDRIPSLGRMLRRTRLDELPQILNVLKGEMSLIGPRPDFFHHARKYLREVPGYRQRHSVLPGISGLAQTDVGYVSSVEETKAKVRADLYYIANFGVRMDIYVFFRTLRIVFGRLGR